MHCHHVSQGLDHAAVAEQPDNDTRGVDDEVGRTEHQYYEMVE